MERFKVQKIEEKKSMLGDSELCSVKETEVNVQKLGLELQISMHT